MIVAGSRVFEGGEAHAGGAGGGETKLVILGCPRSRLCCVYGMFPKGILLHIICKDHQSLTASLSQSDLGPLIPSPLDNLRLEVLRGGLGRGFAPSFTDKQAPGFGGGGGYHV